MTPRQKRLLGIILPIQAILAVAAWRDLARRTDEQLRGKRNLWRAVVLLNPGNSLLYWLFGRRGGPVAVANRKATRVEVPDSILAKNREADPSYSCAYEMDVHPTDPRSAEAWLRAMMEGGPGPLRLFILVGWVFGLRLRLGPRPSTDHILGWRIVSSTPTEVVIGVQGAGLSARQVVQVDAGRVVHATVVRYERPASRFLWAVAAPIHVRVIPYLMEQAATRPA